MSLTIAQKIIARAAGTDAVAAGDYVTVTPDYTVMQDIYFWKNIKILERLGVPEIAYPDKVVAVLDHTPQAALGSEHVARNRESREFVRRTGFSNFFDAGRAGLRHLVMVEHGFARPGLLVFSDEPNIASIGAVGALNVPISTEVLVSMVRDSNWVRVPASVRFELTGTLPRGVWIRDLVQAICREYAGGDGLVQRCVEFGGPGLARLGLDSRQGLLAGMYHAGADTAVADVDEVALDYVRERAGSRPYEVFTADEDAAYDEVRTWDLGALEPYVTVPPRHSGVVPVSEVGGRRITQATVGSCASNRIEDLRAAAEVLRDHDIAPGVTMYVTPGSPGVYAQAAREGLVELFTERGATVLSPGCTTCWGYLGALGDGDVAVSTNQENYPGRAGSRTAEIYLASPYVVAASAVTGRITDPRQLLPAEGAVRALG
ncbi:3-isopropylmalate dehydratase [Streptomyces sp. HNM0575]|uniref:3-isopropylmalate dehydratase large subunit n=1 Tax=Streptomyces sp. HNM0575 TaxID=2716338 RepID=UPI00145C63DD|nr:aconitase family protein [Streptomyces sp. HNM0575]NLU73203.1 3-isopropylmalate dehydratase [Streptomyces sp. HNM0575]